MRKAQTRMKWVLWSSIALMISMLIVTGFPVFATETDPTMAFINPETEDENFIFYSNVTSVGDTFIVNATVANVTDLYNWQVQLQWDSSLLNCTRAWLPSDTVFAGMGAISPSPDVNNEEGYALIGSGLLNPPGINVTEGVLCQFNFTIIKSAGVSCELAHGERSHLKDSSMDPIPNSTFEDAHYEYNRTPPAYNPWISVEPTPYNATKLYNTTAKEWEKDVAINITIHDVHSGWRMVVVEFSLLFDYTMLEARPADYQNGSFMETFVSGGEQGVLYVVTADYWDFKGPNLNYYKVGIIILPNATGNYIEPFPSGNGTLITLHFTALHPYCSCNLTLFDINMKDDKMQVIPQEESQDGYYEFPGLMKHKIIYDEIPYYVVTVSNTFVSPIPMLLDQSHRLVTLNVTVPQGTAGFINITIPKALLWLEDPENHVWLVFVGGELRRASPEVSTNATYSCLYLTLEAGTKQIWIIGTAVVPEFPVNMILMLFLISISLSAATAKTLWSRKTEKS